MWVVLLLWHFEYDYWALCCAIWGPFSSLDWPSLEAFEQNFFINSHSYYMSCPSHLVTISILLSSRDRGSNYRALCCDWCWSAEWNKMLIAGLPGDATKLSSIAADVMSVEQLAAEMGSVALDWKTLRNIRECICSTPFDHFSRKVRDFIFSHWYPNFFTQENIF